MSDSDSIELMAASQAEYAARGGTGPTLDKATPPEEPPWGETFMHLFEGTTTPQPAYRVHNTWPHSSVGGIVSRNSHVDPTAYVQYNAEVWNNAFLHPHAKVLKLARVDGAVVGARAEVTGTTYVSSKVEIIPYFTLEGGRWEESPPQAVCGRFTMGVPKPGYFTVGCQQRTIDEWVNDFDEIAEQYDATPYERATAWVFLRLVCKLVREGLLPK